MNRNTQRALVIFVALTALALVFAALRADADPRPGSVGTTTTTPRPLTPTTTPPTSTTTPTAAPETVAKAPSYTRRECLALLMKPIKRLQAEGRRVNPAVMAAQALVETGNCNAMPRWNAWGIKAVSGSKVQRFVTHEEIDGVRVKMPDNFAAFDSIEQAADAYADLVERAQVYGDAEAVHWDSRAYLLGISEWATDSRYQRTILNVIDSADLIAMFPPISVTDNDS